MHCREAGSLFSARLDGELGWEEGLALDEHLAGCRSCLDEYRSLAGTVQLLRDLPSPAPDPAFIGRVFDRVRAHEAQVRVHRDAGRKGGVRSILSDLKAAILAYRVPLPASLAAAVLLGVLTGVFLFRAPGGRETPPMAGGADRIGVPADAAPLAQGLIPSPEQAIPDTASAAGTEADSGSEDPVEVLTPDWWAPTPPESPVHTAGARNGRARIVL